MDKFKQENIWVLWNLEQKRDQDKPTKVPVSVKGGNASSTDPETWASYKEVERASEMFDGIGFVFPQDRMKLGIDIDKVLPEPGATTINPEWKEVVEELIKEADTYTEYSPTGKGLHLIFSMEQPITLFGSKKDPFEVYNQKRFFTFTGRPFGEEKEVRTVSPQEMFDILAIIGYPWKKEEVENVIVNPGNSPFTDEEVLELMFKTKKDYMGKRLKALYEDTSTEYENNKSRQDYALLKSLAFWTARDTEQMERIWLASPLGQRNKTKERGDYRKMTIDSVISRTLDVYTPAKAGQAPIIKLVSF